MDHQAKPLSDAPALLTVEQLAASLNGRDYGKEISKSECERARDAGLVVVFGYSDDGVELRGAINDELGAYNGTTFRVSPLGLIQSWETFMDSEDDEDAYEAYFAKKRAGFKDVECLWAPDEAMSWAFRTEIPHATFDVMEDGVVFCRGIVFRLADCATA